MPLSLAELNIFHFNHRWQNTQMFLSWSPSQDKNVHVTKLCIDSLILALCLARCLLVNHLNHPEKKRGKNYFLFFFFWGGGGLTGKSIYSRQFVLRHLIPLKCKTRKKKITPLLSCVLSVLLCLLSWIYQYMLLRKDNKLNSIEKRKLGSGGVGYISSGWKQG